MCLFNAVTSTPTSIIRSFYVKFNVILTLGTKIIVEDNFLLN